MTRRMLRELSRSPFVAALASAELTEQQLARQIDVDVDLVCAFKGLCSGLRSGVKILQLECAAPLASLCSALDGEVQALHRMRAKIQVSSSEESVGVPDIPFADRLHKVSAVCSDDKLDDDAKVARAYELVMESLIVASPRFYIWPWLHANVEYSGKEDSVARQFMAEFESDRYKRLVGVFEAVIASCAPRVTFTYTELEQLFVWGFERVTPFVPRPSPEANAEAADLEPLPRYLASVEPPRVLIVAGSDSGGGAGIQADIKACDAHGAFSTTAIAALTAQNSQGVQGVFPVPPSFVREQMRSVLSDLGTDVVKTGMLGSAGIVSCVADELKLHLQTGRPFKLVVDPVMVSTSGHKLLEDDAVSSLKEELLPLAYMVTPNLPEASLLLGRDVSGLEEMEKAAKDLCAMGPEWALVKGGHSTADDGKATDVLCSRDTCVHLSGDVFETTHTHGTGCTLASSIAAQLACGAPVQQAVQRAKHYVSGAIKASVCMKMGSGPQGALNHLWEHHSW